MKMVKIAVALFEKGDRVLTCEGFGTIQEDEDPTTAIYYRKNIRIKLDEASTKWGSCEGFMDPDLMIPYFDPPRRK